MKYSRWSDHLPAWLAYGAVATTGIYEPWEVVWMALPIAAAAGVEAARLDLGRWRRWLQTLLLLLIALEILFMRRQSGGFLAIAVHLIFMLMGLRLALPRELPQRRQLLLMGFMLFLTTAISTADLEFMAWALAWVTGASLVLLQQAWEPSALLRRGPTTQPPYARTLRWTLACLVMAGGFFILLPRITLGLRPLPWSISSFTGSAAGLSDIIDLGNRQRISGNSDIVMRIQPPKGTLDSAIPALAERLALLRGVVLERLDGAKWEPLPSTPRSPWATVSPNEWPTQEPPLEIMLEPISTLILALPYGGYPILQSPRALSLSPGPGASIRWTYRPMGRQYLNIFGLRSAPEFQVKEPQPFGPRRAILAYTGSEGPVALRFANETAPKDLSPRDLAELLTRRLRTFRYTLENPSGSAADPIADFLFNTRAGHCEYFASSLALMLRSRGVFARVVNGYRLGPWSPEGGYFLVTQNEAHSWVEYFDPEAGFWRVADPTPPAPPNDALISGLMGSIQRWADAIRFQWDRHVVRFSGEDQALGFDWVGTKITAIGKPHSWSFKRMKGSVPSLPATLLALLIFVAITGMLLRTRAFWMAKLRPTGPGGLRPLRPLLRRTRRDLPPKPGETLRAWLQRLAQAKPEREEALLALTSAAEAVAYGDAEDRVLKTLVKAEVSHWKS